MDREFGSNMSYSALENVIDKADLQAKYGNKQGQGIQGAKEGVEGNIQQSQALPKILE